MRKQFQIPFTYRSSIITNIKKLRNQFDRFRKDLTPTVLNLETIILKIARHFGFCYGVENAIEIAYRAIEENPQKKIYLISEMIHNPHVNQDLQERGVQFLMKTDGTLLIPFDQIQPEDVVIIPAFGVSIEILQKIYERNPTIKIYNTTCPFVEKVWHRAESLGKKQYTIVIHGRPNHEETRATFSHAKRNAPAIVIQDKEEAKILAEFIKDERKQEEFFFYFQNRTSEGFNPQKDLQRIGVVNQTTMLATETLEISEILKNAIIQKYGDKNIEVHFADTKDTLCYATWENQSALIEMLKEHGDIAIIVGGYNSSNTSHLVEICEEKLPTFYIKDEQEILSKSQIRHLNLKTKQIEITENWLPDKTPITILLSAGASCPDSLVDKVIRKIVHLFSLEEKLEEEIQRFSLS
ncbi:MAG: 4-hydroxy-3-methylbut-2-enyl diphosphate reductase [Leptospiraceae bacterium]|nr:4-hydroxy-3-methylbut-2-enyl diphosphate reductase [Leptospiraceae bacterium]MDW7976038.1 4-hydroxy-3-methylbut-2-enyl diphosphate reductase [Leptospiraceae bacterium]